MFFNPRSIFVAALAYFFALEVGALVLNPITDPTDITAGKSSRRDNSPLPLDLLPISDPGVLTHGRSLKREEPGNGCFDPSKQSSFFWGAYAGDNIYVANFTMSAPNDDEFILPVENFAKRLKSIDCGARDQPMVLEFADKDSFTYAQSAWKWVDDEDINHFTLVTQPDQCYKGDNRSPYLVSSMKFDEAKLKAYITAEEKEWPDVAHTFKLHLGHEYVNPTTVNVSHPHLKRDDSSKMDISMSINQELFNFAKDSKETKGLALSADAEITTGGYIISDFDIERIAWVIPKDININIHPQGVHAMIMLSLNVDGTLGKALDWTMKPEIDIPIGALNIKGVLEIGPFVTMGVHVGSSALEGTGTMETGAKATLKDDAEVKVKLRHPEENSIKGWTPEFEKVDPTFSAEIGGDIRAWGELGIQIKAEAFGRWGYQASVDAELPYFEATMDGLYDAVGVCSTKKTLGIDMGANVGINVNLNAGRVNEAPDFQKDLFETSWPLYSTCIGIGNDNAKPTDVPSNDTTAESTAEPTAEPTGETPISSSGPIETGKANATVTDVSSLTVSPIVTSTPCSATGTGSINYPITANSTFLNMVKRKPTALYL